MHPGPRRLPETHQGRDSLHAGFGPVDVYTPSPRKRDVQSCRSARCGRNRPGGSSGIAAQLIGSAKPDDSNLRFRERGIHRQPPRDQEPALRPSQRLCPLDDT